MVNTIQEVFNSKYFQGITSKDEEAYYVCKEQMTNTGNKHAYIWYMLEAQGRLQGIFSVYERDSEEIDRNVDAQKFEVFQEPFKGRPGIGFRFWTPVPGQPYNTEYGYNFVHDTSYFVQRRNPHTLSELARVATLDNCHGYCCLRSLELRIDEFQIPKSLKDELKKLARGFRLTLEEKIPNELYSKCIHN